MGMGGIDNKNKDKQIKAVNLFYRVKGFYLRYQDISEPKIVKAWNVNRFIVHRHKRHQDINIRNQIWKEIEAFLKKERFKDAGF